MEEDDNYWIIGDAAKRYFDLNEMLYEFSSMFNDEPMIEQSQ